MALELRLTPQALRDLDDIWGYTSEKWSAKQAERYQDGLTEAMYRLCEMPELARERIEITPAVRLHPTGSHIIVYRVAEGALDVLRVLGARQDWLAILAKLDERS